MRASFTANNKTVEKDEDFFDGALRGIYEELGTKLYVSQNDIKILSFCIEFPTYSFDVMCIANINNTFEEIKNNWKLYADDLHEARDISPIPMTRISLVKLFFDEREWHPTSRMRIFQLLVNEFGYARVLYDLGIKI